MGALPGALFDRLDNLFLGAEDFVVPRRIEGVVRELTQRDLSPSTERPVLYRCPTCGKIHDLDGPPQRAVQDVYPCFFCEEEICIDCYIAHNEQAHPELYGLPRAKSPGSGGGATRKKPGRSLPRRR